MPIKLERPKIKRGDQVLVKPGTKSAARFENMYVPLDLPCVVQDIFIQDATRLLLHLEILRMGWERDTRTFEIEDFILHKSLEFHADDLVVAKPNSIASFRLNELFGPGAANAVYKVRSHIGPNILIYSSNGVAAVLAAVEFKLCDSGTTTCLAELGRIVSKWRP